MPPRHAVAPTAASRPSLHDRRHVRPPGLARWRRSHHGRGHAMDDGREGHPAHRDTAGRARRGRRSVPRIQLWVNLPARDKMIPAYQGLEAGDVTLLSSVDGGALLRIIAGDVAPPWPRVDPHADGLHATWWHPGRFSRFRGTPGSTRSSMSSPDPAGGQRRSAGHEWATRCLRRWRFHHAPG